MADDITFDDRLQAALAAEPATLQELATRLVLEQIELQVALVQIARGRPDRHPWNRAEAQKIARTALVKLGVAW